MLDIYHNKEAFKKQKPFNFIYVVFFIIIILALIIYMIFKTEVYDHYEAKSYVTCTNLCTTSIAYPSNITYDFIQFNNKNITYQVDYEEIFIDEESLISFKKQSLTLLNNDFQDKEIITVNFYYHKQRLINKLLKLIFRKGS